LIDCPYDSNSKNFTMASVNPIMPRLLIIILKFEAGVVGQI